MSKDDGQKTDEKYADIIDLPHPDPRNHVRMPKSARAAQFASFAALTGFEERVENTARKTEEDILKNS